MNNFYNVILICYYFLRTRLICMNFILNLLRFTHRKEDYLFKPTISTWYQMVCLLKRIIKQHLLSRSWIVCIDTCKRPIASIFTSSLDVLTIPFVYMYTYQDMDHVNFTNALLDFAIVQTHVWEPHETKVKFQICWTWYCANLGQR